MRSIILLLLSCTVIWATGNTCTLTSNAGSACATKTCALSAIAADTTHANWSGTGCTANGYVPSSDYIVIPDGFNLTADRAWVVGNYALPFWGYVYGVTGLPSGGFSGTCTAAFSGGSAVFGNLATGTCTISGGNVTAFALTNPGTYNTATAPTVTFTGSGGGSGAGTVQFIGGGGTAAVYLTNTGVLQISAAVTARGSITYYYGSGNTTDSVIGLPGGSLIFDSSGASDPTDTRYWFGANYYNGVRAFHAEATSSHHFTVTSQAGGGNGFFGPLGRTVSCCSFIATYTDFSNLGDALFNSIIVGSSGGTYDIEHSTFTSVSPIYVVPTATSIARHDYNVHTAPTGTYDVSISGGAAVTTGVREVIGNVFASYFQGNVGASGITITGNYLGGTWLINNSYATPWASFSGNFIRRTNCADNGEMTAMGSMSNSYYYGDGDCNNMHWLGPYDSSTYDGLVFDIGGDTGYGDGNILMRNGSATTLSLTHSITVMSASGFSSSAPVVTFLYGGTKDGQWTVNHNTIETHGVADAAVDTEGTEPSAGQLASLKSNLIWGLAAVPAGYNPGGDQTGGSLAQKFVDSLGAGAVQDIVAPTNADYNSGWNIDNCSHWSYTNQGKGYCGKFSATPGAHDVDQDARFADPNRSLMLFDYYYLGHQSYPAWQTSHSYSVGDTVINPISWFYGGLYVNYRCIVAHTSDTTTEPGAARFYFHLGGWIPSSTRGEYWRTYWEPASLYQLRQGVAAQATITDGAIGCVSCSIIDALRNWVFTGYTPLNPALWCAGHDGEAIGAVPFCAKGKALVAAMGVIN